MNTQSLKVAIERMIEKLPTWREDAIIYQYDDGTFDCDPRSTYESVVREHQEYSTLPIIYECHDLNDVFPDFGNCEDDAAWLLAQIINEQLGTDVSAAAAIMGKKGGRSKSPTKQQASRTNGKLGGRPKKEKMEEEMENVKYHLSSSMSDRIKFDADMKEYIENCLSSLDADELSLVTADNYFDEDQLSVDDSEEARARFNNIFSEVVRSREQ